MYWLGVWGVVYGQVSHKVAPWLLLCLVCWQVLPLDWQKQGKTPCK